MNRLSTFSFIMEYLRAKRRVRFSRKQITMLREKLLRRTIAFTFHNSPFYRNLWSKAGFKSSDLATLEFSQLPIVEKKLLMENFEEALTERGLKRNVVEHFFKEDQDGGRLLKGRFVALHTSGTSGLTGIFLFTTAFWSRLTATLSSRIIHISPLELMKGKMRMAFIGEVSGHHAGITLVRNSPALLFKTLSVPEGASEQEIAQKLSEFRPTILTGYASTLARAAEVKIMEKLTLSPRYIISSGEPLSTSRRNLIDQAFRVPIINFYGATECLALGANRGEGDVMELFDDIVYLESVDRDGKPLPQGSRGRVVITVFGNEIQPLIRYALDDDIILLPHDNRSGPWSRAKTISGRIIEQIRMRIGQREFILYPMELIGFFVPGLRHYQIIQTTPAHLTVRIVASHNWKLIEEQIRLFVDNFLASKGLPARSGAVSTEFVSEIKANPKTGKTPIIVPLPPSTVI